MKRLPIIPTIIVGLAVAAMIGLGLWQLQRLRWKEGLLRDYAAARALPPIAYPSTPDPEHLPLFRRSSALCLKVTDWRSTSGRNRAGQAGWIHIAGCTRGAEGPGFQAVMGWSTTSANPRWTGGMVTGMIAPDSKFLLRLVADDPAPGLQAAASPDPADIPNNHLTYAVQWFLFALVAAVIYVIAVRKRLKALP